MPILIATPFILAGFGYFFDKAGEGIDSASNGVIKIAVAGGIGYIVLKKAKVI